MRGEEKQPDGTSPTFLRSAWRFLVLAPFIYWVGGFTFYTAVVVPIGTEQLGRDGQGFITREVTKRINLAAAVSLVLLFADLFVTRGTPRTRAALWLLMAACQAALFWLHAYLDAHLDPATHGVRAAVVLPVAPAVPVAAHGSMGGGADLARPAGDRLGPALSGG